MLEIASWKLKSPPKSRKSQNHPTTHNIAPGGDFAHVEDHCYTVIKQPSDGNSKAKKINKKSIPFVEVGKHNLWDGCT